VVPIASASETDALSKSADTDDIPDVLASAVVVDDSLPEQAPKKKKKRRNRKKKKPPEIESDSVSGDSAGKGEDGDSVEKEKEIEVEDKAEGKKENKRETSIDSPEEVAHAQSSENDVLKDLAEQKQDRVDSVDDVFVSQEPVDVIDASQVDLDFGIKDTSGEIKEGPNLEGVPEALREFSFDIKNEFRTGFERALEADELDFNCREGCAWVGDDYTMVLAPAGIRLMAKQNVDKLLLCDGMSDYVLGKRDLPLLSSLSAQGVVYTGLDPENPRFFWVCKFRPLDGGGWFKPKDKKSGTVACVLIKNEYLWKGIEHKKFPRYPAELILGYFNQHQFVKSHPFPFTPSLEEKAVHDILQVNSENSTTKDGKRVLGYSEKNVRWLVDEMIRVFLENRLSSIDGKGQYFLCKTHLMIVFPKILDKMSLLPEYSEIKLPNARDISNSGGLIFEQLMKIEKVEKSPGGRVQREFRFAMRGKFQEDREGVDLSTLVRPLRGLAIPIKEIGKSALAGRRRVQVRFYDTGEHEPFPKVVKDSVEQKKKSEDQNKENAS
jgi:hypothetical protein